VVQIAVGRVNFGNGTTPTLFGGVGGSLCLPRHISNQLYPAASDSSLWFGYKNPHGAAVSGFHIMRGAGSSGHLLWDMRGGSGNGVIALKTFFDFRQVAGSGDYGSCAASADNFLRARDCILTSTRIFNGSYGDVILQDCTDGTDRANGEVTHTTSGGHAFQLSDPTDLDETARLKSGFPFWYSVQFLPDAAHSLTSPLRYRDLNRFLRHASGEGGGQVYAANPGNQAAMRLVDSYVSGARFRCGAGVTRYLESAFTINIQVVNEEADPVEGARVILLNQAGTAVVNQTTNFSGRIPLQDIVDRRFTLNQSADVTWRFGDSVPAPVSETDFNPFTLLVIPDSTSQGFEPHKEIFSIAPFIPNPVESTVVVSTPRPRGLPGGSQGRV
jgi:hypothetical protein